MTEHRTSLPGDLLIPTELQEPRHPVKDSWVRAFKKGNIDWPQNRLGVGIRTTLAVLQNPPTTWPAFFDSSLSSDQVKFLYKPAYYHHTEAGIPLDGLSYTGLETVWDNVGINSVRDILGDFIYHTNPAFMRNTPAETFTTFFGNPQNGPEIAMLTGIMHTAKDALVTDELTELSDIFKSGMSLPYHLEPGSLYELSADEMLERHQAVLGIDLREVHPDDPHVAILAILGLAEHSVKRHIMEKMDVGPEDIAWFFPTVPSEYR